MAIFSKTDRLVNSSVGSFLTPLKMIIENESNLMAKKGGTRDWLFNVEKSNHYAETVSIQQDFSSFTPTAEGAGATQDRVYEYSHKTIEHIQFMKEFVVTAEMMEDAVNGIAADAKRRAQNFVRAYYKTINKACEFALANGTSYQASFSGAKISLSTQDGFPLFSSDHMFADDPGNIQSNYFWGDALRTGTDRVVSTEAFAKMLYAVSSRLRNMRDDNFDVTGYTADTIILPGNRPILEAVAKTVCGSDKMPGSAVNDINLHFGNWNIVIMPSWAPNDDRFMVMSSEANKNLAGNMFFNRVPLTVSHWIDHHTGNHVWTGRCRFGIGFCNYKHIALVVDSASEVSGATRLAY